MVNGITEENSENILLKCCDEALKEAIRELKQELIESENFVALEKLKKN